MAQPISDFGKDGSPEPGTNFPSRNVSACSAWFRRPLNTAGGKELVICDAGSNDR
jgi:hypothetical protein